MASLCCQRRTKKIHISICYPWIFSVCSDWWTWIHSYVMKRWRVKGIIRHVGKRLLCTVNHIWCLYSASWSRCRFKLKSNMKSGTCWSHYYSVWGGTTMNIIRKHNTIDLTRIPYVNKDKLRFGQKTAPTCYNFDGGLSRPILDKIR